ncbi:dihydropteroate synthase [Hippea maritima]|uniref:Dihydropteroate synthase n=1 Tax=Hippea maritima (strain ATCC 700847 / DSM 10411 / MH2) TaxID=760142 RepID=F2LUR4_HIPMA|nr:dihydropteroate synthase [Hippea maritima]AEA33519.1 dihydropteroate synthase [Hippea maritima DSM 10411]
MIELLRIDDLDRAKAELRKIGVDRIAIGLMDKKAVCYAVRVFGCKFYHANILKQEALSLGVDAAVEKDVITAKTQITDCLIMGDAKRLIKLAEKLKNQNFEFLRELSEQLKKALSGVLEGGFVWKFKDRVFELKNNYLIMGILNVTPDSFSDGGEFNSLDAALKRTEQLIQEGADIIDVGGESTRPGSEFVSLDEELRRVVPVVEAIKERFDVLVSVDTYKSKVAEEVLNRGVEIINDISGLDFDDKLLDVLSNSDCGIVEMHIKGTPKDMQKNPTYEHLLGEINDKFEEILSKLKSSNVDEQRVVLDPGIGFGKRFEDNLSILNHIESFKVWGRPILIGTSRKSFIGAVLGIDNPQDRLFGTVASNVAAFIRGASIFRVHDVKAHKEALRIAKSIIDENF